MSFNPKFHYQSLQNSTSVRLLLVAPGSQNDDVYCFLQQSDLDADPLESPTNPETLEGLLVAHYTLPASHEKVEFAVETDISFDTSSQKFSPHPFQRYIALSYVWGDTADLRSIRLNEQQFMVTKNLDIALRSLRTPSRGVRVWIDAICINQADLSEKAGQIRLMKRIYNQARQVRAQVMNTEEHNENLNRLWFLTRQANEAYNDKEKQTSRNRVCQDDEDTSQDAAKEDATGKIGTAPKFHLEEENRHYIEDYGLPPKESELWNSWREFIASPYFSRVWILQEYVLAKELCLVIGNAVGDHAMLNVMLAVFQLRSRSTNPCYLRAEMDVALTSRAIAGYATASCMTNQRVRSHGIMDIPLEKHQTSRLSLIKLLEEAHAFSTSDPRDKVFALLGLAADEDEFLPLVTYEEDFGAVFAKFARKLIELGHGDSVLRQAALGLDSRGKPSWIPDWSGKRLRNLNAVRTSDASAGGNLAPAFRVSPAGDVVVVRGFIIDTVSTRSLPLNHRGMLIRRQRYLEAGVPQEYLAPLEAFKREGVIRYYNRMVVEFMAECLLFFGLHYSGDSSSLRIALLQTVIQAPAWMDQGKLRSVWAGFWTFLEEIGAVSEGPPSPKLWDFVDRLDKNPDSKVPHHEFINLAGSCCSERRLLATSGGLLGAGPPQLEVDDKVVVLRGCKLPFILRPNK